MPWAKSVVGGLVVLAIPFFVAGPVAGSVCLFVAICVALVAWTPLGRWLGFHNDSKARKIGNEIATIQRELIRHENRREVNGGSIWPIERPYRDLPTDQWQAHGSHLRLDDEDREAVSNAYELAARFNDEMLRGETFFAGPEPDLAGLRDAFDDAADALGLPSMQANVSGSGGKRPPELSLGRVHIPRQAQQVAIDPDGHSLYHPMGRILKVPVINEQGAETARSVQALLHFMPDDQEGAFSPRHPALAEWDTEPPATSIDSPGNGQPHLFDVALVLNQGHPCVFEWTRHSRNAQLHGFGIGGPGIIKVEVKGSGSGEQAPAVTDTLRIEAHAQIVKANWDSAGPDEADNWVPK